MASDNVHPKRQTDDEEIPAELGKREAQDRATPTGGSGGARSPVDSMHVDAPRRQDNARGHAREK